MEIKIFNYPLSGELSEKVEKILDENFGLKAGRDQRVLEENKNIYFSHPERYILCFDNKNIVGVQNIFLRETEFRGQKILIGGLGGLCVDKKYRGRGIAKELLQKATEELKKMNCDIGMLFTEVDNPRFKKLYGQFRYVILGREYSYLDKKGERHTGNAGMIALVNSEEKFNLVLNSKEVLHVGGGEW